MLRKLTFAGCFLVLLAGCVTSDQGEYQIATLVLPEGHPGAGRDAFLQLGCASCHDVEWEPQLAEPHSATPGPELDRTLALQTSGGVATSILAPSHHVPLEVRAAAEEGLSPMGDFTEAMTVRQLIDVVAYLRAQGTETVARVDIEEGPLPPGP